MSTILDYTDEELEEISKEESECYFKYSDMLGEALIKAANGEFASHDELLKAIEKIDDDYSWDTFNCVPYANYIPTHVCKPINEAIEKDKEKGGNLRLIAKEYAEFFGGITDIVKPKKKLVFMDDDGNICDEYGNRLSEDGRYRVFEAIKGGKK